MKKFAFFFAIIIVIVIVVAYKVLEYNNKQELLYRENKFYEDYLDKEISGVELTTVINKAMDSNNSNSVELDEDGKNINNNTNSINIDIKMLDNDKIYNMEKIYKGKMSEFVIYYRDILFKCTKIYYHNDTGRVKYLLFEQITT